ncbi:MAG: uroporphyrinogen-III synthase [Candidatus Methanoperedens sp.]|nr:uroporphyrinogen-III synthase [Candidatus Methanoperedens sp.]
MKIAVTKLKEKSEGVHELFARYGHVAFVVSTMKAAEPTDPASLSYLCDMVSKGKIDILIFTSSLGVERLFGKIRPRKDVRIVCVGPKTAKKVKESGMQGEVIAEFSSDNFAGYLGDINGKTIGIARAEVPNPQLTDSLTSKGARVVEAAAYALVPAVNEFLDVLKEVEAVIFTSAKSFELSGFKNEFAGNLTIVAIGPKTADAMRKYGVIPDFVGNGTLENCLLLLKRVSDTCK